MKPRSSALAIRRHTEVLQRLVDAVVPDPDFHHLARFFRGRDLAAELLGESTRSPRPAAPT